MLGRLPASVISSSKRSSTSKAYWEIWTFCFKIGQALALGITGLVLSLSGYVAGAAQADSALFGIRLLLGPIPAAIFGLALFTLWRYPINEARYNEILAKIRQMEIGRN